MRTEETQQQSKKQPQHRSFLFLIVEEARQTSLQLCEHTLVAQETAQELVRMSRLRRQMRKETMASQEQTPLNLR
jgi:hypothetical protein